MKLHRGNRTSEQVLRGIQMTINGISAGLRNSGWGTVSIQYLRLA